jgi:hypothetical protein
MFPLLSSALVVRSVARGVRCLQVMKNVPMLCALLLVLLSCAHTQLTKEQEKLFGSYEGINSVYGEHPTKCPIHNTALVEVWSWVSYGLPVIPAEYKKALIAQFPCSYLEIYTGLCTGQSVWGKTLGCSACRSNELDWRRRHNWPIPKHIEGT